MSSTQCLPWLNVCLCLIHWCLQEGFLPSSGHTCGRHHWLRLSGSCQSRIWLWLLVSKKTLVQGTPQSDVPFSLQCSESLRTNSLSHCLPEKSTFPSFWDPVNSESIFRLSPLLWRGNSCDQAALPGSARGCPAEPWPLSWESPCFSRKLQSGHILSGFKNCAGGTFDYLNLNIKCLSRGRLQVGLLVD